MYNIVIQQLIGFIFNHILKEDVCAHSHGFRPLNKHWMQTW